MSDPARIRVSHTTAMPGAAWLGAAHLVVDAACVASVLRASPPSDALASAVLAFVLGYDLLAFAGQVPCGWLIDRFRLRRGAALAGLVLTALALLAGQEAGAGIVLLAGLGNALFHVGAGAMVLGGSKGRAAPAGVFVAPGALGLGLGIILGRQWLGVPLSPLLLAVAAAGAVVLLAVRRSEENAAEATGRAPRRSREVALVLALLSFSVAVRSLVGTVGCDGCPRGFFLLLAIPLATFAGKLSGGFLADRFGFIDLSMVALLASGPLLAFAGGDLWLALPGLFLFQMTMPVTLVAAFRALPKWPGLGFGILCLALVAGTLPAYLPGGWRPHGVSLFLLVLASAAALYLALRLLLNPEPHAATAGSDAPASTYCRGLP